MARMITQMESRASESTIWSAAARVVFLLPVPHSWISLYGIVPSASRPLKVEICVEKQP